MPKKPLNFDFVNFKPIADPVTTADAEVVDQTPFDQFDLITAQNFDKFVAIKNKIAEMTLQSKDLKVTDDASCKKASEMRIQIKALIKSTDEAKLLLPAYKTASEFKNGMDKFIRENLRQPFEALDRLIAPKVSAYQKSQAELQRRIDAKNAEAAAKKAKEEAEANAKAERERQEKEQKEALSLQGKLNKEADAAGVDRVQVPIPEVQSMEDLTMASMPETPVTPKTDKVVADHGSAKVEAVWKCTVVNPELVPQIYCSPDQKKLDSAIEFGVREIPGCKIEEDFEQKIRLSRKRHESSMQF